MGSKVEWGWSDMEELLQCPICFEQPSNGVVEQCLFGHHICSACKPKVENCPLCKCAYGGTRNFVVEEIMRNFEILKNTMLLTAITEGKKINKVEQTNLTNPKRKLTCHVKDGKGIYPCGFRNCDISLPGGRLLNHVRSCHSKFLLESCVNEDRTYSIHWMLNAVSKSPIYIWQRAIFISGIGLVFFTFELLNCGFAIMTCQMASQEKISCNFKAKISAQFPVVLYEHTAKLLSTREKMENMLHKDAYLLLDDSMMKSLMPKKSFKCTLELSPCGEGSTFSRTNIAAYAPPWLLTTYRTLLEKTKTAQLPRVANNSKHNHKKR